MIETLRRSAHHGGGLCLSLVELLLQLILLHLKLSRESVRCMLLLKELLDLKVHGAGNLVFKKTFGCDVELLLAEAARLPIVTAAGA